MGLRGPGAKPKKAREAANDNLRTVLPWEAEGLSRVDRVIAFLEDLNVTQGKLAGTKLKVRPWQRKFLDAVYREDETGNRPVRTAVLSMARKNGKTQIVAGLALCHLVGPEAEPRGEVFACANDRFQAGKTFNEMVAIISEHKEIEARVNIIRFRKEIEVLEGNGKGSVFAALSADAATKHGLSPSFIVYDELGQATKRDLYEALDTAMGARENPLMCVISTQAASDFAIMSELVDYGQKVTAGEVEDKSFHLTFYGAPDNADPWAPETWELANPALGDFRSLDDVERQAAQAQRVPSKENAFRNLILNQRVDAHVRFIAKAEWDACDGAVDVDALRGRVAFGALDLSAARDLSAWVLVFPNDDGTVDVLPRFYLPETGIGDKSEADRVPYDIWAKQGFLTLVPGKTIDPAAIAEAMAEDAARFDIQAVAYDRWRIEDLRRELSAIGAEMNLVPHGQGFKDMSPAVDVLERMVAETKLRHAGNPILKMCAANAVVTKDPAGGRKLDKAKAAGRIDGLVALSMSLNVASRHEPESLPACLLAA
ncbi:phage terminase large subunit-like protein [Ensifer sp. WSM1721]|uniref:terminase large subunit n=1 Tax=Ensifer sp. WSM1721 TaxID=1041159 RepID=UPI00047C33E1|nr:terminase TerL endonuclease subunit [Ensifer sp. WSM1721]